MKSMRTVVLAILFAAAIVSWAIIERFSGSTDNEAPVVVNDTAPPRQPIPVVDSNNDGVPDWQEMVLSTKTVVERSSSTNRSTEPETLTDAVSQEVFVQFIDRAYGGNRLNSNAEFTSIIANEILAQPSQDSLLTRNDIQISPNESNNSLKLYGDRIALIIEQHSEDSQNELEILNNALRVQDPSLLSALDAKIIAYNSFYEDALNVTVPPSLADDHLQLLNSFAALRNDLSGFRAVFNDPVLTLSRIQQYQLHVTEMANAFLTIYGKILQSGVSVTPNDPSFAIINALATE